MKKAGLVAGILFALTTFCLAAKPITIMPLGDSITEGGPAFKSYRMPLWELLVGHGYVVEFVGSRQSEERIGPLRHEGHSGKTAEFLAEHIAEFYRANPADVVLLHSGHNHFVEEKPVAGILQATRKIVATIREINPHAVILLAQPIPSGKQPKYAYLPELSHALAAFAEEDRAAQKPGGVRPVVLVDQAANFDWRADTIDDHVHPNAVGAQKIAQHWYEALQSVLPAPAFPIPEPARFVYKRVGATELVLNVFQPNASAKLRPAPAVVYFFAGGWQQGTPIQFFRECARLAQRGVVGISADYRIKSANGATPFDSLADAKAAMRWVRAHAAELGVDPTRIAAAGASAGGHLAAASAFVPGFDDSAADRKAEPINTSDSRMENGGGSKLRRDSAGPLTDDLPASGSAATRTQSMGISPPRVGRGVPAEPLRRDSSDTLESSCHPDALVLLYPVIDTGPNGYHGADFGEKGLAFSPLEHVSAPTPPTLLVVGTNDAVLPVGTAKAFQSRIQAQGGRCEIFTYPGRGHPLWSYRSGEDEVSRDVDAKTDAFLESLGWILR